MSNICGVPLQHDLPESAVVVGGIGIVHAIDADGRLRTWASPTEGMSVLEALELVNEVRDMLIEAMRHD